MQLGTDTPPVLGRGEFYGRAVLRAATGDVVFEETAYAPESHLPVHGHEHAILCAVVAGAFTEWLGGRRRECTAAQLVYRPPGETHAQHFGPAGSRCVVVQLVAAADTAAGSHVRRLDRPLQTDDVELRRAAARLRRELADPDEVSPLALEGLALEMLARVARLAGRRHRLTADAEPRWLRRAEEYVRAHYASPMTLAQVADAAGVSATRLARALRRHRGTSVAAHVRQLRAEAACALLTDPEQTLGAIAARLGYCDQSHFTRAFRRATGMTPWAYRRRA